MYWFPWHIINCIYFPLTRQKYGLHVDRVLLIEHVCTTLDFANVLWIRMFESGGDMAPLSAAFGGSTMAISYRKSAIAIEACRKARMRGPSAIGAISDHRPKETAFELPLARGQNRSGGRGVRGAGNDMLRVCGDIVH